MVLIVSRMRTSRLGMSVIPSAMINPRLLWTVFKKKVRSLCCDSAIRSLMSSGRSHRACAVSVSSYRHWVELLGCKPR